MYWTDIVQIFLSKSLTDASFNSKLNLSYWLKYYKRYPQYTQAYHCENNRYLLNVLVHFSLLSQ